jgi:hypothetical protein
MRHTPEIVKVLDECRLIDSESYQQSYRTGMVSPPIAGYYVVRWPDDVPQPRFDENACFKGPFPSRAHAQMACEDDVELA